MAPYHGIHRTFLLSTLLLTLRAVNGLRLKIADYMYYIRNSTAGRLTKSALF